MEPENTTEINNSDPAVLKRLPSVPKDRYEILDVLGSGGMGVVLKAKHLQLNSTVAIKVLKTSTLLDNETIKRFQLEAQAGSQLVHPNLISVFDYGVTEENEPYLVMEYIEGKSMSEFLDEHGKLSPEQFLDISIQIAKVIEYIHSNKILHRDIKSGNVMLHMIGDDIGVKLLDFGIVKVLEDSGFVDHDLTATGTAFGSPVYMSPESCMGKKLDYRSDIYSYGCLIYECLTGLPPIVGENLLQTLQKQISDEPKPLPGLKSNLVWERKVAQMVHKCLQKKVENRYQSMKEIVNELQSLDLEEEVSAEIDSFPIANEQLKQAPNIPHNEQVDIKLKNKVELKEVPEKRQARLAKVAPTIEEKALEHPSQTPERPEIKRDAIAPRKEPAKKGKKLSGKAIVAIFGVIFVIGMIVASPVITKNVNVFLKKLCLVHADSLYDAGEYHWSSAKDYYSHALTFSGKTNDIGVQAEIHCKLGAINLHLHKINEAKDNFQKANELVQSDKANYPSPYVESLVGLGQCLHEDRKYKKANDLYTEAHDLAESWDLGPEKVADIMILQAKNYSTSKKRIKYAINYYDHAIMEYRKVEKRPYGKIADAWLDSAQIAANMHWWKECERYIGNAVKATTKISDYNTKNDLTKRTQEIKEKLDTVRGKLPVNQSNTKRGPSTSKVIINFGNSSKKKKQ